MTSQVKAPTFGGVAYSDQVGTLVDAHRKPIKLRRQCLEVFLCLAATPDAVVEREDIVRTVWGQVAVTDDSLVQCISEIRKALDDSDRRILKTLPRRGYMLVSDVPSSSPSDEARNTRGTPVLQAVAIPRLIGLSLLVLFALAGFRMFSEVSDGLPVLAESASDESPIDHTPTLSLTHIGSPGTEPASSDIRTLFAEQGSAGICSATARSQYGHHARERFGSLSDDVFS